MRSILLSGAKTWTRVGGGRARPIRPRGSLAHHPPSSVLLLTPNEPYLNLFSLPSHPPGSSKREVINHRAINNQYFSSNVYRVRFKCLVKTNLRLYSCALFASPQSARLALRAHPTSIYHGRHRRKLSRWPCAEPRLRNGKEGRRLRNARGYHVDAIFFLYVPAYV